MKQKSKQKLPHKWTFTTIGSLLQIPTKSWLQSALLLARANGRWLRGHILNSIEEPTFFLCHGRVRVVNYPGGITQKYPYIIFAGIGFFRWVWKSVGLGPREGLFWEWGPRMRQISLIHMRGEEASYCKRFINLSRALLSAILSIGPEFLLKIWHHPHTLEKLLGFFTFCLNTLWWLVASNEVFLLLLTMVCAACSYVLLSSGSEGTSNKHWFGVWM